jgi:hypothetical protein
VDEKGVPLTDTATLLFDDLLPRIGELDERLRTVEHRMDGLKESFALAIPRVRLCLRPWTRKKGERPYALYWVYLVNRRRKFDDRSYLVENHRPRWFHRLKVQTCRYLDAVIYRAGLSEHRTTYLRYHAASGALNEAHRVLARGLDSARKMLASPVTGPAGDLDRYPVPKRANEYYLDPSARCVTELLWKFDRQLFASKHLLRDMAERQAKEPRWVRFRLVYLEDTDHPYGRLLWRDLSTGMTYTRLDDRTKRRLRIYPEVRRAITRWEIQRRWATSAHKKRTGLIRRLKALTARLLQQTSVLPEGYLPSGIPEVDPNNDLILPETDFSLPSESGYFGDLE